MIETQETYPFWLASDNRLAPVRLGLSEAFLEELGGENVLGVEIAAAGTRVQVGDTFAFLHLATRSVDLRAPFAFMVVDVNRAAEEDARLVAFSPYTRGWLAEISRFEEPGES